MVFMTPKKVTIIIVFSGGAANWKLPDAGLTKNLRVELVGVLFPPRNRISVLFANLKKGLSGRGLPGIKALTPKEMDEAANE
jgi:hypothetical protein